MDDYDVAQVCPNGHVANSTSFKLPQFNSEFCETCGEKTLTLCPNCRTPVRGEYCGGGVGISSYQAPAHCHACGKPFPWTERRIQAALDLVREEGNLAEAELAQFEQSVNDITRDTPQTQVAASRLKRLFGKMGVEAAKGAHDILVDVVSESVKKMIWPTP